MHHRVDWLDHVFVFLSRIGTAGLVWIVIGLVVAVVRRRPDIAVLVLAADGVAQLLAQLLKRATNIERPSVTYPQPEPLVPTPTDLSFPSGHAASSFACVMILAFAVPRLAIPLYLLAAGIAWSRVYVGVHYPLDIAAGALLGIAVAIALRWLVATRRRSRPAPRAD